MVRDIEIDGVHYQQTILRMPEKRTTRIYCIDITKRKLAEEALQDSEVRFRSLIQNSSDIIRILDRDGHIVYDSPSSEKILGYPPGYTLGKSPLEFIHPDDRAHIMKDLGLVYDVRNSGIPSEFRIRKADGEYLDCESVGMNMIGIPGVDGIVVTTRLITERKQAEKAIRENEERYRLLFEHMMDGFAYCRMLYDDRGRPDDFIYLAVNSAFARLTGVENVVGKRATEAFPDIKESSPELFEIYGRVSRSGVPEQFEIEFKPLAAWLSISVYSTEQGYFSAVFDDVTERKRAEEERERLLKDADAERARLQAILDALPVGVTIADASGRILVNNDALRKIWCGKAPLSEVIEEYTDYQGWWTDTGKPVRPEEWGLSRAVTKGETSVGEVIDIQRFDGSSGTMLNSAAPVRDAGGKIIGAVVILQDITQRRQMERDLSEAKAQAELYLDLMGHDISNMHQIILMQLELALTVLDEEGRLESKDREMLTSSVKTLDRSVNLISNVRMLQKVRSGEYRAEPLDLGHVIRRSRKDLRGPPGKRRQHKIRPSSGHMVMASPLIKDVLGNLVDNAVKHSKDPVEISIGVIKASYKGAGYYRVSVEDNGIGIPDEKKDLIFQRFKRGQTAAKGTGLGLYIVRTLVEGFGGRVEVEDRVRGDHTKGARFIVYLPVTEVKNDG